MEAKTFAPGEIIFEEGQSGKVMYVLAEGTVELRKKTDDGAALLKTVCKKNEFFGEMSLIDDQPRSAHAIAVDNVKLFEINEASFEHLVKTNGAFALRVIQILSERIRNSNCQIRELTESDQKERIQCAMVDFSRLHGEKIFNGGIKVHLGEMKDWINNHMGIALKDIETHLFRMIKMETVTIAALSQKTQESIILSPEFLTSNERRTSNKIHHENTKD